MKVRVPEGFRKNSKKRYCQTAHVQKNKWTCIAVRNLLAGTTNSWLAQS